MAAKFSWLPSSWLYLLLTWQRMWLRLNGGDRIVLGLSIAFMLAMPCYAGVQVTQFVAKLAPRLTGVVPGLFAFGVISLCISGALIQTRASVLFRFLPETLARKRCRVVAEFCLTCLISAALLGVIILSVPSLMRADVILSNLGLIALGHFAVHLAQFLVHRPTTKMIAVAGGGATSKRGRFAEIYAGNTGLKRLKTSSYFLLKANSNPFVWLVIGLVLVSGLGAAITLPSILIGLSTLSQAMLIWQLTLTEPRVGNGVSIGAHSRFMPIQRAWRDCIALSMPHVLLFCVALAVIGLHRSTTEIAIAVTQLVFTLWLIWIVLITKAQDAAKTTKSLIFFAVLSAIASQIMPPLVIVVGAIMTILSTRDLARLSKEGPATWPR